MNSYTFTIYNAEIFFKDILFKNAGQNILSHLQNAYSCLLALKNAAADFILFFH